LNLAEPKMFIFGPEAILGMIKLWKKD
jgi:hypothetical protein